MMRNRFVSSFIASCFFWSMTIGEASSLCAQQTSGTHVSPQTDSLAQFVRNILTYNEMYPREHVYLHFDNTGYFMGETIWYKAYVVDPQNNNQPTRLSRVLYVELLTPEGRVLETQKLKIENGQCCGQISLKTLLHPGYYEVRAYTAVMLNWEDAPVFSRVFPIFTAPQKEGEDMYDNPAMIGRSTTEKLPEMRPKAEKQKDIHIQFFPEGGLLVADIPTTVAFKATDKRGNSLSIDAVLYNNRKEQLATLTTLHDGMGRFNLTPISGESYHVEVMAENGRKKQFVLPTAEPEGVVMNVNNLRPEQMMVQLTRSEQMDTAKVFGLTVMCRGKVILFRQIQWQGKETTMLTLPKQLMPAGINQITLFDTDGRIYAERLAFVPLKGKALITCTPGKEVYQPKEMVEMNFQVMDENQQPLPACFSVSVRDTDRETPANSVYGGGIMANLLLGSELKGYIHNVDWYFQSDDRNRQMALDLLLCTQGWRKYDWTQMTRPHDFVVKYPIEEGILVRGDLTSTFRNRIKQGVEIQVFMYNDNGENRVGTAITDSVGKFAFLAEDFYGRWTMNITTFQKDKAREMNVNMNKIPSPPTRRYAADETALYIRSTSDGETTTVQPDTLLLSYDEDEKKRWENLLPSVNIDAAKEWQSQFVRKWNNLIYDMEDERMRMDETGENYLMEFYKWLEKTNPYFSCSIDTAGRVEATYKERPVRFFVSRLNTGGWFQESSIATSLNVDELTINDVEAIAISDKPNAELAMRIHSDYSVDSFLNQRAVVISVFVREDYFRYQDRKGHRRTKMQGFSPALQFYTPDYTYTDLPDEKDFRRTLYWNPNVVTNAEGKATIQFPNSPYCRRMKVSAETVTGKGRIGGM